MGRFDSTCWTVVLGAAAGRAADREDFSRRYAPVLRAYFAARWKIPFDHDDVIEATQEVFVQCFKEQGALERVDPERPGGFRAFLYGIARNVAVMQERKWARRHEVQPHSGFQPDQVEGGEATLSQVFDRAWAELVTREARLLLVNRAGADGSPAERVKCLELRYQEGLPPRQIAAQLGVEVEAVYEMLARAKKEFRVALFEVMGSYNPGSSEKELEQKCVDLLALL